MKIFKAKKKLVRELTKLSNSINVVQLYHLPRQDVTQNWLADVAAVLKKLDEGDYQEFIKLSRVITPTEKNRETRKKAAYEINAFIKRKVAEYKKYDFSDLDKKENSSRGKTIGILNEGKDNTFQSNRFFGLNIGILDRGKGTKAKKNVFKANEDRLSLKKMGIVGIILFIIIVVIVLKLGYRPTSFTLSPQLPFIGIDFDSS